MTGSNTCPDGRFLFLKQGDDEGRSRIRVVTNWFDELERLVPTDP